MQKTFKSKSLFHNFSLLLLVLIYALLIISIDSCTGDQSTTPEENSSLSNSYYPLQVGNQWVYHQIEVGYDTVSVKGERIIDGKKYFEVFKSDSENPPSLYREENGVIYDRYESNDYIILDPSRPLGEKWQRPYNRSAYIASRTDTVFSSIGPIFNCKKIIIDGEFDIPDYAPGSLIVKFTRSATTQKDFRIRVEQARVITGLPTIDSLCALFKASSFKPFYREIYNPIEYEKLGRDRLFIFQFPAMADMENIADIFLKDPNIEEAYPNYLAYVDVTPFEILYAPGVGEVSSNLQFKEGFVIGGRTALIYAIINGDTIPFTY